MIHKPNILFILADDIGSGDFSLFANVIPPGSASPEPPTPQLSVGNDGAEEPLDYAVLLRRA